MPEDDEITARQAAEICDVSVSTLNRWIADKDMAFPSPVLVGCVRLFSRDEVERWAERSPKKVRQARRELREIIKGAKRTRGGPPVEMIVKAMLSGR